MSGDLETRVRELEDRAAISETVIRYAMSLDRCDMQLLRACVADPIHIDFSDWSGMEPRPWSREEWAGFAEEKLSGFAARHHMSPNHVITFDGTDRATCLSYMFAQHYLPGAKGGDEFLMRGWYTNVLDRTPDGWRISSMTQHFTWGSGNDGIFAEAEERPAVGTAAGS